MSIEADRQEILERFTCAHIRLTRAPLVSSVDQNGGYHWAPGCGHPKMHALFDGQRSFCERCPCYMQRLGPR